MIAFESLRREHLPLLGVWLRREHVRRWWGDESVTHAEDSLAGRDPSMYYAIVVHGQPVGMIQTYLVSDHPEWQEVVGPGEGLAGVDLLIGEEDATAAASGRKSWSSSRATSSRARGRRRALRP